MTTLVSGENVSSAWLAAVSHLLGEPTADCSNLAVAIRNPTLEVGGIRRELEAFREEALREGRKVPPAVDSVAGTIFPAAFYRTSARDPEAHLYEMERKIRHVVRKHPQNRHGTYFERLVAYPVADEREFNQLHHVLERLRSAVRNGRRKGNQFELSLFHPERDPYPVGFPCLSHVSVTLRAGVLDATAIYRNQYYVERAYGNFIGLGNLLRFLATESGFATGELLCVASHAELELSSYGKGRVKSLVDRCSALVEEEAV